MDHANHDKPQQKGVLDLRIRLDERGQFIGLSINGIPVDLPMSVEPEPCQGGEAEKGIHHTSRWFAGEDKYGLERAS